MKYLLDTAVWLWSLSASERIGGEGLEILENPGNEVYLSAASSWEISIKSGLGKLRLPEPPTRYVPKRLASQGIRSLPITHQHALAVSELPAHHNDPFDRFLIAQARLEGMTILTADRVFQAYAVEIVWCKTY